MDLAALLQRFAEAARVQLIVLTRAGLERIGPADLLCSSYDPSPDGPCMNALTSPKDQVADCVGGRRFITLKPRLPGLIQLIICRPAGEVEQLQTTAQLLELQLEPFTELGLELPGRNPLSANLRGFLEDLVLLRDLEDSLGNLLLPDAYFNTLLEQTRRLFAADGAVALWKMLDERVHATVAGLESPEDLDAGEAFAALGRLPTRHTPVKEMANKHLLRFDGFFGRRYGSGVGLRLGGRACLFYVWDNEELEPEIIHRLEVLQRRLVAFTERVYEYTGRLWAGFTTLLSVINALEARDTYSRGHSERVMRYAVRLGRALGLGLEELFQLRFAAVLHDVGKLGLAEDILGKDTPLDESDWVVVRRHPIVGEALVGVTEQMKPVAAIIRHHHERWDGEGYPNRLAGEDIPRLARILAIAEAYDAMTSERPFRHPLPAERAGVELEGNAGRQFDPQMVELFVELIRSRSS
jgi:HD-GYP domain-containing protein (c-di-GMP phosphodiesterase class II)